MKRRILLFWISLFLADGITDAFGQDFRAAVQQVQNFCATVPGLFIEMQIAVRGEGDELLFNQTVSVFRSGNNFRYQMGEQELMLNENFLIMVDHGQRQISCVPNGNSNHVKNALGEWNIDSLWREYGTAKFLGRTDRIDRYEVNPKDGVIARTEFDFDTTSGLITAIRHFYANRHEVTIAFRHFEAVSSFEPDTFSESRYFVDDGSGRSVSSSFRGYQLFFNESTQHNNEK